MGPKRCIFVVDDEHDVREVICEILLDAGFDVLGFASAAEALDALASRASPDLFLLDLFMPEFSGAELVGELRRSCDHAEVPVLFLSAAPHLVPVGLEVMGKPFDGPALVNRVTALCDSSVPRLRREG